MSEKVFTLRMDADLLERVKKSADKNKRSMAKEIEYILEFYFVNLEQPKYERFPFTPEQMQEFFDRYYKIPESENKGQKRA